LLEVGIMLHCSWVDSKAYWCFTAYTLTQTVPGYGKGDRCLQSCCWGGTSFGALF